MGSWLHANAFCGAPLVAQGHEHAFWRGLLADGPLYAALREVMIEHRLRDHPLLALDALAALAGKHPEQSIEYNRGDLLIGVGGKPGGTGVSIENTIRHIDEQFVGRPRPASSISLSLAWPSDWSFAEADARCWNGLLRTAGLTPRPPGRFPRRNGARAVAWRVWRRLIGAN